MFVESDSSSDTICQVLCVGLGKALFQNNKKEKEYSECYAINGVTTLSKKNGGEI